MVKEPTPKANNELYSESGLGLNAFGLTQYRAILTISLRDSAASSGAGAGAPSPVE